jgi:flagellar hook-associated protein 3
MRISTSMIFNSSSARLSDLQSSLVRAQEQISTGRRMLTPADDPVAAARALEVTQAQSANTQYATNRQNVKDSLSQEESTLQGVTNVLQDVKTLIVSAGNPTYNDTDRKSLATQLQGQYNQLLGLANSVDGTGNYLFAGYQTTTQPFLANAGGASYLGDQGQRLLQVGPSQQIAMSDTGNDVFERNKTGNGIFTTAAVGTNTGTGIISSGTLVVPNGYGTSTPAVITNFSFGQAAVAQVDGTSDPKTVTSFDFSLPPAAQVDGTSDPKTVTTFDFSAAAVPGVDGTNVQNGITNFDFSGGNLAQFNVNGQSVTLTTNAVDEAGLAALIQSKLTGITVTGVNGSGTLTFSNTGNPAAVAITNTDVNANTSGFANSAGTAGTAATPAASANFSVDGTAITLDGADTDMTGVAAEMTSKMQASALGASYSASVVSGQIVITQAGSTAAVAITGADANAIAAGITNSPGVAGSPATTASDATFSVDGVPITLNGADGDATGVAAELTSKMQASALGASYSASVVSGQIVITQAGSTAPVAITGADADAVAAGITNSPGVAGSAAIPTTNATFSVDGTPITLNGNDTDISGVAAELTSKMQASALGASYSASVVNGKLVITHTGTQAPVAITGADANAVAAGIVDSPGVAGNVAPPIGDQYRLDFSAPTPGSITYSIVDTTTGFTLSSGNPYTSGEAITFNGLQFNITGTPADGDQFTVQPSVNQSVFTTLKNLINVLNTPATDSLGKTKLANGLATASDNLAHALDNVLTVRSSVGSRLNSLDALDNTGTDKDVQYSTTLSQLQDLDYSKAITQLMQQQTTLTAAQQSFVKISGLSLFNYL